MPSDLGPFRRVEVSPSTIIVDEDEIRNTVSIVGATLSPWGKNAEHHDEYMTNVLLMNDTKEVRVDRRTTAKEFDDARQEYAVHRIVRHIVEGDNCRQLVRWNGYTTAENTAEPSEHLPKCFISRCLRLMQKNDEVL